MSKIKFYPHQIKELEETQNLNKVAYYHDMGLGKTFVGAEKLIQCRTSINLIICQKSKVSEWLEHFEKHYFERPYCIEILNLSVKRDFEKFLLISKEYFSDELNPCQFIGVINYELAFRRPELLNLIGFTLLLDESSLIQNDNTKRTKFIMKLKFENLILLSGTPTSGKYEHLWSQLYLLGWNIRKELFWKQYIDYEYIDNEGFPIKVVKGYKNIERLKQKMRQYGCRFLKTENVFELPVQNFNDIYINSTNEYKIFKRDSVVNTDEFNFVGDTVLTKILYERMLCGVYNMEKLQVLHDLLEATNTRIIIFYNFNNELDYIKKMCIQLNKPVSVVNGNEKNLQNYESCDNSVTLIQYQAGAMGLNLQKANIIIYFTPTRSSELFEQSKKRIHRIGQNNPCFYYKLICKNSIEEKIYKTLALLKDYTEALFDMEEKETYGTRKNI